MSRHRGYNEEAHPHPAAHSILEVNFRRHAEHGDGGCEAGHERKPYGKESHAMVGQDVVIECPDLAPASGVVEPHHGRDDQAQHQKVVVKHHQASLGAIAVLDIPEVKRVLWVGQFQTLVHRSPGRERYV